MAKYDWGDGKGKVHSRAKRKRGGGGTPSPKAPEKSLFDVAMDMATKAYEPVLRHARAQVKDAQAQVAPGGVIDSAYDRSQQAVKDAQAAAATQSNAAAATAGEVAQGGVDAAKELGAQQNAQTARQAQLYGQTAEAAKAASDRQGASAQVLASNGADIAGLIAAIGKSHDQLGVDRIQAGEMRRGDAMTAGRREVQTRRDSVTDLRTKRAADAQKTASDMGSEQAKLELAMDTLGIKDRDSRRDYRTSMAGIRQQKYSTDVAADTKDEDRRQSAADKAADRRLKRGLSKKDRLAKYDTNRNGRLDKGDKGVSVTSDGKGGTRKTVTYHTVGGEVQVSPGVHAKATEERAKVQQRIDAMKGQIGVAKNFEEARKASGIKDPQWARFAFDVAVASQRNGGKLTIPKKYESQLRARFPDGKLPYDLGKALR